jgi:hypothetical protein
LHPDHLLRQLTAKQWAEWQAYFEIWPTPEHRSDLRAATIGLAVAKSAGSKSARLRDFLPDYIDAARREAGELMSNDDVDAAMARIAARFK